MRAFLCVTLLSIAPISISAAPYDGTYRPDYPGAESWNCRDVGMDGGAVAIRDGMFHGVENSCRLTNPTPVRGLGATLFDAECAGEGETYSERIMLMPSLEGGVVVVREGWADAWVRCE